MQTQALACREELAQPVRDKIQDRPVVIREDEMIDLREQVQFGRHPGVAEQFDRLRLPPGIAAVAWQHGGFVERPISCTFVVISALLVVTVTWSAWRSHGGSKVPAVEVPDAGLAVKE
ncbi:hypothetical protein AWV79_15835 [Cupriavidus sp. UYMMa02A]|nr:hypothetical protein AWV79_15835 [Cupriavidus sp. UYMMa02A]